MNHLRRLAILLFFCAGACRNPDKPLDADTRRIIDSLFSEENRRVRAEMDTLCLKSRSTVLPHLVDSIRQVRLSEIEKQLKTVPK